MRIGRNEISLELDCWVEDLSAAQLAAYERVTNEHNAIKNALKSALTANEGRELFNGQVFQAYSFKGKVLQELREATLPPKPPKPAPPPVTTGKRGRKPNNTPNLVYLESSDEGDDDVPLAKRIALAAGKKGGVTSSSNVSKSSKSKAGSSTSNKGTPQSNKAGGKASSGRNTPSAKVEGGNTPTPSNLKPSEITAIGGLVIGNVDGKDTKESKTNVKEGKLQGKTFPSLVVLAKPWLKVKDMSATRSKLDSKVKLVLMLTPTKFTEWLIQEGLIRSEQKSENQQLKLGVYCDATKFPYTGGYVWINDLSPIRFVSVFHGSIFEGAPHPPSCILKLIYHWSCQTSIQNVVQWVKVDNVYIKGVYTWLRAVCTLAVHQKCKKLGGPDKHVEVGVISLGTTTQDGMQREVKVEVLGVLDYAEKSIRLKAVDPVSDADRNYKKRFQTILEPLQRWVHKDSIICIDLTVERTTLHTLGFKHVVQAPATDSGRHTNSAIMDYLRRIVPRMFQNTLSLLSRQMIQQFLDELVWREHFGTYALQAFNNITSHIAEQTRMTTNETLTQRLYQVATNPFKDWSPLPPNYKESAAKITPKRLKKPINEADYLPIRPIKKEKESVREHTTNRTPTPTQTGKRRAATAAAASPAPKKPVGRPPPTKNTSAAGANSSSASSTSSSKKTLPIDTKIIKKEEDDLRGLEELYYGVRDGHDDCYENFPYTGNELSDTHIECPICDTIESFNINTKLQSHLLGHINGDSRDEHRHQCPYCLEKFISAQVLSKHNHITHPCETKANNSPSYYCLICQQRFSSLNLLSNHLQKLHNQLELPYGCQACAYRSSSQRDLVRHFYEDHKQHNFLQCPFCLDIMRFSYKGKVNISNIENYYMHVRQHTTKKYAQYRCQKCVLTFNDKGSHKQHTCTYHVSLLRSGGGTPKVRPLLSNSLLIVAPKTRQHHRDAMPYAMQQKFGDFFALIDGSYCAECNAEIISEDHFAGLMKCQKCNYRTCCERAMFEHSSDCTGGSGLHDVMELPLPNEMHCICGFSTAIGNKMAQHLVVCGQKSAYNSVELAQENTVKRNMLDMLGLVRRDGEGAGGNGEMVAAGSGEIAAGETVEMAAGDTEMAAVDTGEMVAVDPSEMTVAAEVNVTETGVEYQQQQQEPIQYGVMEATAVTVSDASEVPQYSELQAPPPPPPQQQQQHLHHQQQQAQYTIGFGQPDASDIDMPLIGELADPNPPATPQFLGEVHTPMFDAVAAAEQQHYHQLLQPNATVEQQQQQQQEE